MKRLKHFFGLLSIVWKDKVDTAALLIWLVAWVWLLYWNSPAEDMANTILLLDGGNFDDLKMFAEDVIWLNEIREYAGAALGFFWLYGFTSILRIASIKKAANE
jgi:hypothetical protein